jgi:hypothetical protein
MSEPSLARRRELKVSRMEGVGVFLRGPMLRQIVVSLLLVFLAVIGVNWPELPFNARLADAVFVPLAIAVMIFGGARWTWRLPDTAVALYLLGAIPAIIVSTDHRHSLVEFGREVYLAAIYFVVAIAARSGLAKTIGTGMAAGAALLAIAGLAFVALQVFGARPWPPMGDLMPLPYLGATLRLRALTVSEAMLACVLTAAVPFAIAMCRSNAARAWCAMAGGMTIAAALTFSHAVAGFAVAVVVAAWPHFSGWPWLRRAAAAAAILVVLVLNFAATISIRAIALFDVGFVDRSGYHHAVDRGEAGFGGVAMTYDVMSYARIKQVAFRAFAEHPIAGVGLNRFHTETERAFNEGWLPPLYREIDPHSTLIGRLAECGLIGGITLVTLWIAWAALARGALLAHPRLGLAATAALSGLIVSSLNADIMNLRFLWVIAGLLRGLQEANGIAIASGRESTVTGGTD